ncbi:MAG: hypothetical protein MZW92_41125, partial [Comamonadaceae bacterium]|nr:hypothetical protein [Comamonadaceae bacterium]
APAARALVDLVRAQFVRDCARADRPPRRPDRLRRPPGQLPGARDDGRRGAGRPGEGALQPSAAGPGARHALHLDHLGPGLLRRARRGRGRACSTARWQRALRRRHRVAARGSCRCARRCGCGR